MDMERLEWKVLRSPLQELEFRTAAGCFLLGKLHCANPTPWHFGAQPVGQMSWRWYAERSLPGLIACIEADYPEIGCWLAQVLESA